MKIHCVKVSITNKLNHYETYYHNDIQVLCNSLCRTLYENYIERLLIKVLSERLHNLAAKVSTKCIQWTVEKTTWQCVAMTIYSNLLKRFWIIVMIEPNKMVVITFCQRLDLRTFLQPPLQRFINLACYNISS